MKCLMMFVQLNFDISMVKFKISNLEVQSMGEVHESQSFFRHIVLYLQKYTLLLSGSMAIYGIVWLDKIQQRNFYRFSILFRANYFFRQPNSHLYKFKSKSTHVLVVVQIYEGLKFTKHTCELHLIRFNPPTSFLKIWLIFNFLSQLQSTNF